MNIGKIISVEYDKFKVKLFHTTKNSTVNIGGQIYYFGNIGSYLKTNNAIGEVILCEVVSVLDHNTDSKTYSNFNLDSSRELIIKPIGTFSENGTFSMGVGIFPSIYADVSIVTFDDVQTILSPKVYTEEEDKIHDTIELGISKNLINYTVSVDINSFFNIHTAILGNSGSGKSNTISHIFQQVFRKEKRSAIGSKIIVFDVNGEYKSAFSSNLFSEKTLKYYKPNSDVDSNFILPYYLMNLDEWLAFLLASDRTQKPFWDKVLQECYKFYKIFDSSSTENYANYFKWKLRNIFTNIIGNVESDTTKMTAARGVILKSREIISGLDKSFDYEEILTFLDDSLHFTDINFGDNKGKLSDFLTNLVVDEKEAQNVDDFKLLSGEFYDFKFLKVATELVLLEEEGRGNYRIREFTATMLTRLDYFLFNPECTFMKSPANFKNATEYLEKVLGIGNIEENQLVLIDTSEVGNDILELTTSVISRLLFDYRKLQEGTKRRESPIHLVLDEAHRYIKKDTEYIIRDNIFERIAREGRKFSFFLMISSQRPSELSQTVLSQCGNYLIHRIQNEIDMKYIYSVLPYFSDDYIFKIKQSVPGEVLIFGNCVPMPLQLRITKPIPDPNSQNCIINKEWFTEMK